MHASCPTLCDPKFYKFLQFLGQKASSFYSIFKFHLFIYLWLCWVFAAVLGLSLAVTRATP